MNKKPAYLDRNTKIWRYLDFPKFASMLQQSGFYFQSPKLFEDPFEMSFNKKIGKRSIDDIFSFIDSFEFMRENKVHENIAKNLTKKIVDIVFVNCWHMSEHESEAMWKMYSNKGQGIAIASTVGQIQDILPEGLGDVFAVQYVDFIDKNIPVNPYNSFQYKRKSFEHEKEVRAMYIDLKAYDFSKNEIKYSGDYLSCNLEKTINEIVVSPYAENWYFNVVSELLLKYDLKTNLLRSQMLNKPRHMGKLMK